MAQLVAEMFPALRANDTPLECLQTRVSPQRAPSSNDWVRDSQDVANALRKLWRILSNDEKHQLRGGDYPLWVEYEVRALVGRPVYDLPSQIGVCGRTIARDWR